MWVSEVFYSIQGEGAHMGRPAAFVRFFGCDLDCDFCDEPLHKTQKHRMSPKAVVEQLLGWPVRFVILTGGEPSLEDRNLFIGLLHSHGFEVAVETNGYEPDNIGTADWITYSPKDWDHIKTEPFYDELKLVCDIHSNKAQVLQIAALSKKPVFLQPKAQTDLLVSLANAEFCRQLILEQPKLRLSLGLQRFLRFK
ncbi:MAG: hypothetical protein A2600_00535 [Candidatus Lambdaproteobacteria bacterium RIFOXYD1_FULL_56_27]|uniref:7-carboxy-7-deazaguanine synthase n=1 Tax=Candidatus Lambdaproteobacteria bacterium RIFOXYD2_FULL_56_26 TaxID=1817773 RepID=A0A1F6GLU7_9PROT|nr:MAG: hypothetical protein A2557_09985 [Candidatus Lambdaproteobacteria bacterium RIFOXYD2_FULL_56_26]OGH01464.1 MAG: hypothetical protein A2426_08770 [Candidatus Lambdaproteobacteria bacterium RIFOXYC1_FULL_56_13]OGH07048.1 MAG: hypothetical protein A2600_00535 [Candidatus Lambdaproteobacteria bacterium RIFOXYD1_FULL_56_27]